MSETPEPEPPRTFVDPPRWMDGMASLFSSGLFALAGVMLGITTFVLCVLLAVGIITAGTAIPWILVLGLLAPLLLFLHGRAERYAGIPGGPSSPTFLTVVPYRRRSLLNRILIGEEAGGLSKDGDGLLLRTRRTRHWPLFVAYLVIFLVNPEPRIIAIMYGFFIADSILSLVLRRTERFPRGRITSAVLCGNSLVLLLADSPESLVLVLPQFHRNRVAALLSPLAPVEELPAPRPPRTPSPPRTPRPPRPAPPPSTAIDAAKEKALDRALDGLKKAKP